MLKEATPEEYEKFPDSIEFIGSPFQGKHFEALKRKNKERKEKETKKEKEK